MLFKEQWAAVKILSLNVLNPRQVTAKQKERDFNEQKKKGWGWITSRQGA